MDLFPPATARVIFLYSKDFSDDQSEYRPFFFYHNEVLSNPEVYYSAKFSDPVSIDNAIGEHIFKRIEFHANGKTYLVCFKRENIDYVLPVVNFVINEGIRKGREEYEWKLKQKENEIDLRLEWYDSIKNELSDKTEYLKDCLKALDEIRASKPYRFGQAIENFKHGITNSFRKLKSFYKCRLQIVRVENENGNEN